MMNPFRKHSAEPTVTGIDLIRNQLRSRQNRDSTACARTARDVSEVLAKNHSRKVAGEIAGRMAPDAGSELTARIARGLVDQFAGVQGNTDVTTAEMLQAFIDGTSTPSLPVLQVLAAEYFNAEIDIETGLLRSLNKTVRPFCPPGDYPPKINPKSLPFYFPVDPKAPRLGPRLAVPPLPRSTSRPGWAGTFFPTEVRAADHRPKQPFVRARPEAYD